jgi:hypothetical protein
MAAIRNGNFSLDKVLSQDILNNNCVERPVDYLQKVKEALGSFTLEKSCQNVAFFMDVLQSKFKLYSKLMVLWKTCHRE